MTKKTIAQSAAIVSKLENENQQSLINNYDKVYKPLFDGLNARQKAFAEYSASKDKVNDKKKAYDIAQGLRDNDGNYLVYSLTELSQYSGFAAMPKKEFCGIVSGLIEAGKIVNTLKTLYKEIKAAERASKNAGKTGKNTPAKKAADTRHKNNMQAAMDELTDGFLVCQKAFEISQSEAYGNMTMPEIEKALKTILAAMMKDNQISQAKREAYQSLKKTA